MERSWATPRHSQQVNIRTRSPLGVQRNIRLKEKLNHCQHAGVRHARPTIIGYYVPNEYKLLHCCMPTVCYCCRHLWRARHSCESHAMSQVTKMSSVWRRATSQTCTFILNVHSATDGRLERTTTEYTPVQTTTRGLLTSRCKDTRLVQQIGSTGSLISRGRENAVELDAKRQVDLL